MKNFKLGKIFASNVEIENFVTIWGMKRPRVQALSAGTIFAVIAQNVTTADKKISAKKFTAILVHALKKVLDAAKFYT